MTIAGRAGRRDIALKMVAGNDRVYVVAEDEGIEKTG